MLCIRAVGYYLKINFEASIKYRNQLFNRSIQLHYSTVL